MARFRGVKIYYQTITEESSRNGDFDKTGEWDEISCDTVLEVMDVFQGYNSVEPSSSQFHKGIWYTTIDPEKDDAYYRKGVEKYYTLHLKGFDEEEERAVYRALFPTRANPVRKRNPVKTEKFYYYINQDERGEFNADIRDENDQSIVEIDTEYAEFLSNEGVRLHDIRSVWAYFGALGDIPKNGVLLKGN